MASVLSLIRPRQRSTGLPIDLRLSSASAEAATGLGGFFWEPAINKAPRASLDLMGLDLASSLLVATCAFTINIANIQDFDPRALTWSGAPVTIYRADALDLASAPVEFEGRVKQATIDLARGKVTLNCEVSVRDVDVPLLVLRFNGGGGINGMAELRGTLLPAGFGVCQNIEPVMFDTIRNIGMIDGYYNTLSVEFLGEGRSSLGPPVADYPTYAALAAAIDAGLIPRGRWATCIAYGLIGLGAPVAGRLSADATFGFGLPGSMMLRALRTHAGLPDTSIEVAAYTALDAAVPRKVHYWTAEQRTVKDLCEKMAQSCNAAFIATMQSRYAVTRFLGGAVVGTLTRNGFSDPPVTDWASLDVIDPTWRIRARVARPGVVFARTDILYADTFADRGIFSFTETYRQGNTVFLADRSEWLYTNTTPSAGHYPPVGFIEDSWWYQLQPPLSAEDIAYGDGTVMEELKPRTAGADATKPALGDVYSSGQAIIPGFRYSKGDIVRDQGADWIFISDLAWDGTFPPALPTEKNAWWKVVKGADVYSLTVLPASIDIQADVNGTPNPGQLPTGFSPAFTIGGIDVSDDVTWSATASGATISALDNTGSGNVQTVTASGVITINGTINGVSKSVQIIVTVVRAAPPPSPGGTPGTSATLYAINSVPAAASTTYPSTPAGVATLTTGTGTALNFSGSYVYEASPGSKFMSFIAIAVKVIYRVAGSTSAWTDAGAEVIGSQATAQGAPEYSNDPGEVDLGVTVTGLLTATSYEFGVVARRVNGASGTSPQGLTTGTGT